MSESDLVEEPCSSRHYEAFLAKQNGIVTDRRLFSVPGSFLIKTTLVKSLAEVCSVVVHPNQVVIKTSTKILTGRQNDAQTVEV